MEEIVNERIVSYLLDLKLLTPREHELLQSRSCQFDFLNMLATEGDKGMISVTVFLNMAL